MSLPRSIALEVVTPEGLSFAGEVEEVILPGLGGYLGILPGHTPLLSELGTGILSYRQGSRLERLYCSLGFAEILPDRVSVLAEECQSAAQVDPQEAQRQLELAERELREGGEGTDYDALRVRLEQSRARLELAEKSPA